MGKAKASAKLVVTQRSAAAVLPKPHLIGGQDPPARPPESAPAAERPSAPAKHEPTLIGLPKQLPNALAPLKPSKLLSQGKESALAALSRQVVNAPLPQHKTGIRLKAPSPPPSAANSPANKRHAAEPTDYDVQVIDAYAMPPLPARVGTATESADGAWDDDVELGPESKRRGTLLTGAAIGLLCLVGLAVCAYAMRDGDATSKLRQDTQEARAIHAARATPEAPAAAASIEPTLQAGAAPTSATAAPLSPAQISGSPQATDAPPTLSAKSAKLGTKAALRRRARAERRHGAHRTQRKVSANTEL